MAIDLPGRRWLMAPVHVEREAGRSWCGLVNPQFLLSPHQAGHVTCKRCAKALRSAPGPA